MIDPSEPNTRRTITFVYQTDENGDMDLSIDTEGFEDNPDAIAFYLEKTMKILADEQTFEK